MEKRGLTHVVDDADYLVYHLGSGPKFVKHAFERTLSNAFGFDCPALQCAPAARTTMRQPRS